MNWSDCRSDREQSTSVDGGDNRIQTVVSAATHIATAVVSSHCERQLLLLRAAVVTTTSCHYPAGCGGSLFHVTALPGPELELEMSGQLGGHGRHRDIRAGRMTHSIDIRVLKRWQQQPWYSRGWSVLVGGSASSICRLRMHLCVVLPSTLILLPTRGNLFCDSSLVISQ